MSLKIALSSSVICFSLGTVFGTSVMALQNKGPFQQSPGPIIEQTAYYAKPGMAETVYQHRLHASEVRQKIGLPAGRIFRRVGGEGELPDVIWQLEYANEDEMNRDLKARAQSREFEEVRLKMRTLRANFSRGFYQPAVGK